MSRKKLPRFEHNQQARNVIERGKDLYTGIVGKWNSILFENKNPIVLELACGKGEYTIGLAEQFPLKNYIGVDIKGDRIARGSKKAIEKKLSNVAFLRTSIQYLHEFFLPGEIEEIWLIHPDPQPRDKEERKRLTNQNFLNLYKKYLKNEGLLYLKTDSSLLFEYSFNLIKNDPELEILEFSRDLMNDPLGTEHYKIETHYGKLFQKEGHTLHFLKVMHKKSPNP